jgi:hypothetical protein
MHEFTRDDVLHRNVDLIHHTAAMLAEMPHQRPVATVKGEAVEVRCGNISCMDAYLLGRPLRSTTVKRRFMLSVPGPRRFSRELRLEWFRGNDLVAVTRIVLPPLR